MLIHFKINKYLDEISAPIMTKKFVKSGTIGRSQECDWVLPDEKRIVSGVHAVVELENDEVFITDKSSNGLFVNHSKKPLGKDNKTSLKRGDILKIGNYSIEVTLIQQSVQNINTFTDAERKHFFKPLTQKPTLQPDMEFLPLNDSLKNSLQQKIPQMPIFLEIPDISLEKAKTLLKTKEEEKVVLAKITPEAQTAQNYPSASDSSLYQAFLRGLGIEENELYQADPHYVLELSGKILHECLNGLVDLSRTRTNYKNNLKVSRTLVLSEYLNPIKHLPTAKEAIVKLLSRRKDNTWKHPQESVNEIYQENKSHIEALIGSFQAVIQNVVDILKPEHIEKTLNNNMLNRMMSTQRKAKLWDLFKEKFNNSFSSSEKNNVVSLFKNQFEKTYEKKSFEKR